MFGALDVIVLVLFMGAVLLCTWRGFVKSLSGLIRFVAAFLLAKIFSPMLGSVIAERLIGPRVYSWLEGRVMDMLEGLESSESLGSLFTEGGSDFANLLKQFGSSDQLESLKTQYGNDVAASEESVSEMVRSFSEPWVERLSTALAAVLIFLVAFIVLWVLIKIFGFLISKIEVLDRMNHILGFLVGVAVGVCAVLAMCYVCNLYISCLTLFEQSTESVQTAVDSSLIFGHLYRFIFGISL